MNTLKCYIGQAFCLILLAAPGGCSLEEILNQTASFGPSGSNAQAGASIGSGARGTFGVLIENNTPFRALFTVGAYDDTDDNSTPVFFQYSPESRFIDSASTATLEGNDHSGIITLACARVFSIGSRSLIDLINRNPGSRADNIDEAALIDGVGFASADASSEEAAVPNEGFASSFEAFLGVDFNCGSLLHLSLEIAEVGSDEFVVELIEVFPAGRDDP